MGFIPRNEKFYDFFERAAKKIQEGVSLMAEMLDDYTGVEAKAKRIKDVEHELDEITHETMTQLNKAFITPIDHEDIHAIICRMDDILDNLDASAQRLVLYKIDKPTPDAREMVRLLKLSVDEVAKAVSEIRQLNKSKHLFNHFVEINRLENEADNVLRQSLARLFEGEKDPIKVIKWKEIYERLESAVDRCEDVANVLEGVVLKNA